VAGNSHTFNFLQEIYSSATTSRFSLIFIFSFSFLSLGFRVSLVPLKLFYLINLDGVGFFIYKQNGKNLFIHFQNVNGPWHGNCNAFLFLRFMNPKSVFIRSLLINIFGCHCLITWVEVGSYATSLLRKIQLVTVGGSHTSIQPTMLVGQLLQH